MNQTQDFIKNILINSNYLQYLSVPDILMIKKFQILYKGISFGK